jgi:hypothetical protein
MGFVSGKHDFVESIGMVWELLNGKKLEDSKFIIKTDFKK